MIQTTQNLKLYDKKPFALLTISNKIIVGAILKEVSTSKTIKWCKIVTTRWSILGRIHKS